MNQTPVEICCGPRLPDPEPDGYWERFLWQMRRSEDGEDMPVLYHVKEIVFLVGMVLAAIALVLILWPISVFRGWLHPSTKTDESNQLLKCGPEPMPYYPPQVEDVARAVEGLHKNPVMRK